MKTIYHIKINSLQLYDKQSLSSVSYFLIPAEKTPLQLSEHNFHDQDDDPQNMGQIQSVGLITF